MARRPVFPVVFSVLLVGLVAGIAYYLLEKSFEAESWLHLLIIPLGLGLIIAVAVAGYLFVSRTSKDEQELTEISNNLENDK